MYKNIKGKRMGHRKHSSKGNLFILNKHQPLNCGSKFGRLSISILYIWLENDTTGTLYYRGWTKKFFSTKQNKRL